MIKLTKPKNTNYQVIHESSRALARSHGQGVRAEGSHPRGCWMDVSEASYYIEKEKNKGSQLGHTKILFFK